ncbi:MAG: hypothetical protein JJE03_01800 [Peptostreptococcaceae bacterium]|nr:hypothetical protein [Peptostreptococcaceae bacterium]
MIRRKKIFGLILIVLSLAGMFVWEVKGRDLVTMEEILVLKENTDKSRIITDEMLVATKVREVSKEAIRPKNKDEILGLESVQFIHKAAPLFIEYFEDDELVADAKSNQYVMAIPNNWLLSYPQSLRRGDNAVFYVDGNKVTSAKVVYAKDGTNKEVVSTDFTRLEGSSTISLVEVLVDEEKANELSTLAALGNRFVIMYN